MHVLSLCGGLLAAAVVFLPKAAHASSQVFNIPAQPLVGALNSFSQASGWQVGLQAEVAFGVHSPGVKGEFGPEQALTHLLAGTGLRYHHVAEGSVLLSHAQPAVNLAASTISATGVEQTLGSVPSTVSVVGRTALDAANINTPQQLVRHEPGVSMGGSGQRAGLAGFNIRGIDGNRVLTQVDGVGVPASYFNGPYAQANRDYVEPETLRRVEILRGPASALYGSDAIGGAVSYYTLDATDIIAPQANSGARLKAGYDGADRSWLQAGTVAGRSGAFDGLLHLSRRTGHETQAYGRTGGGGLARSAANPEDKRTFSVLAKAGWNYQDDARLAFTYEHFERTSTLDQRSAEGGPWIPRRGELGLYQWRKGDDTLQRERFSLQHSQALNSHWADFAQWTLSYQHAGSTQTTRELYGPRGRAVLRERDTRYTERQWQLGSQLEKHLTLAGSEHLLTYGASVKREAATAVRTGNTQGQAGTRERDFPDPLSDTYSLFIQDQITQGAWAFLPGLRYDQTRLNPQPRPDFLDGKALDTRPRTWHRLTSRLGATYAFNEHYSWFGQYAEGFRTPTAKALYGTFENIGGGYVVAANPNLKPERSQSLETGLRGQFDTGYFSLAAFYNRYQDFIDEYALKPGDNAMTFQSLNIKRATILGLEAKGRATLSGAWYSEASLAWARGRNDTTGQPLNTVDPLRGVLSLGYDRGRYGARLDWTLATRQHRVDASTYKKPDGATLFKTPGYGTLDLSGHYQLSDGLRLNAGLYNLANKQYWQWNNVRGYDLTGDAGATAPANVNRLSEPRRHAAVNLVWEI